MPSLTWAHGYSVSAGIGPYRILLWSRLVVSLGPASSIPCGRWHLSGYGHRRSVTVRSGCCIFVLHLS